MASYVPAGPDGGIIPAPDSPRPILTLASQRRADRDAKIAEAFKAGLSVDRVALQFGVSAPTIRAALVRAGISVRQSKGALSRQRAMERAKRVYDLYRREGTLEAAGKVLGISRERVRQILVAGGFFERIDQILDRPPPAQWWQMRADFEQGHCLAEVAARYGVSIDRARRRIKQVGGDTRKKGRFDHLASEMRVAYEAGMNFEEVGARYNCCTMTAQRLVIKAGGKPRVGGQYQRKPRAA